MNLSTTIGPTKGRLSDQKPSLVLRTHLGVGPLPLYYRQTWSSYGLHERK